jgi:1,3,6,8-tetrahydroxynaphthalene synthase
MPTLCQPVVHVPEYVITMEETLEMARRLHADHPRLPLVLRLIENTRVQKRHLIRPLDETLEHPGFEVRNKIYQEQAHQRLPGVVREALANADVLEADIDAIVFVSCTGFTMPALSAWLINTMDFRPDTRQIPIAQLGCAAGSAAINRAHDFCLAHPDANVLIVSCEFCSLCYQPTDDDVGSLLSDGLFGDAVGAAVVRGSGGVGVSLERSSSYLIPDTLDWISYEVKATGFHFRLDKRVPTTMAPLAPALRSLAGEQGWDVSKLDFYIIHAGGPRILEDLCTYLEVDGHAFRHSRATLTEYGNIASAVVLDALARLFEEDQVRDHGTGIIAGFGPGITGEMTVGTWTRAGSVKLPGSPRQDQNGHVTSHDHLPPGNGSPAGIGAPGGLRSGAWER